MKEDVFISIPFWVIRIILKQLWQHSYTSSLIFSYSKAQSTLYSNQEFTNAYRYCPPWNAIAFLNWTFDRSFYRKQSSTFDIPLHDLKDLVRLTEEIRNGKLHFYAVFTHNMTLSGKMINYRALWRVLVFRQWRVLVFRQ